MKKKIICLISVLLFLFPVISACGKADNSGRDSKPSGDGLSVILCDFESMDDWYKFADSNLFGRMSFNSDTRYIRSGEKSLKLEPQGYGSGNIDDGSPVFTIKPPKFNFEEGMKLQDFKNVDSVIFDIYNANDENKTIEFYGVCGSSNLRMPVKNFTLNKNGWTKCVYPIDYENLSIAYDLENMVSLNFSFDPVRYDQELPVYYLDNLLLKYTAEERKTAQLVFEEGEICSFDKPYQQYVFVPAIAGAGVSLRPVVSINTDSRYAKAGSSLKTIWPHGSSIDTSWQSVSIIADYLKQVDFTQYDLDDEIVIDIYNASQSAFSIGYIMTVEGNGQSSGRTASLQPGLWTEVRQPLRVIAENIAKALSTDDKPVTASPALLKGFDRITFINGSFVGQSSADHRTVYFDSFRIVKK